MRDTNDYDVDTNFLRSVERLITLLDEEELPCSGSVYQGDCRRLARLDSGSINAVITSPPYLNAIDYLRGHKLSLVWLGYTIPELRALRSGALGTERARETHRTAKFEPQELDREFKWLGDLPSRQRSIVHKYAVDADKMLREMRRLLAPDGRIVLVLGDSNLRGVSVRNSRIFHWLADRAGLNLDTERKRPLAPNRRYLPITSRDEALSKRMTYEVVQAYSIAA